MTKDLDTKGKVRMKRHDWKRTIWQPGYKQEKCRRCGAERHDAQIMIKYALN